MNEDNKKKTLDVVPAGSDTEERRPKLTIECPKGEIIRIYQELSPKYMQQLISVFFDPKESKN